MIPVKYAPIMTKTKIKTVNEIQRARLTDAFFGKRCDIRSESGQAHYVAERVRYDRWPYRSGAQEEKRAVEAE